jgi:hypothetical protein
MRVQERIVYIGNHNGFSGYRTDLALVKILQYFYNLAALQFDLPQPGS